MTGYSTNYYKSLIGKGDGGPNSTGSLNYGAEWTGYGYPSPYIHSGVRDFEIFITGPTYGGGYIHDRTWDDVREGKVTVWGFGDESFETATIYQGGANPTGLGTVFGDIKLSLNEWHHIAVVRSDSNMQLLVDNELDKTWTWTGTKFHSDYPMLIGAQQWTTAAGTETGTHPNGLQSWFDGYVEDIRISSGARYYTQGNISHLGGTFNVYKDSDSPNYEDFYFGLGNGPSYATTGSLAIECVGTNSGMHNENTYVTGSGFSGYKESYHMIEHKIEGYNIRDLLTDNFSLSFWAKSEKVSGNFPISLRNYDNTISYVDVYDMCDTGTWKKFNINIPPITGSGGGPILESSFNLDDGIGLHVGWGLAASSGLNVPTGDPNISGATTKNIYGQDVTGTSGQWISGFYVGFSGHSSGAQMTEVLGSVLKIAGPELKQGWSQGSQTSQIRSSEQESRLCKRYYERLDFASGDTIGVGQCIGLGNGFNPAYIQDGGTGMNQTLLYEKIPTGSLPSGFGSGHFSLDPSFNDVTLLIKSAATNWSDPIIIEDSSPQSHTTTVEGTCEHSRTQTKWPDSSISFPQLPSWGSYLHFSESDMSSAQKLSLQFGTQDFTVECWFYVIDWKHTGPYTGGTSPYAGYPYTRERLERWHGLISKMTVTNNDPNPPTYQGWSLGYNDYGQLQWQVNNVYGQMNGPLLTEDGYIEKNKWYHVAVSRCNGTINMFLDGARVASAADTVNYNFTEDLRIGEYYTNATNYYHHGYMEDIRITKGVGRYCGDKDAPVLASHLFQITNKFGGVQLNYQPKISIPSVSTSGNHFVATDLGWNMLDISITGEDLDSPHQTGPMLGFHSTTKTQACISGYVNLGGLIGGHATTLKSTGDGYFFVDAEL